MMAEREDQRPSTVAVNYLVPHIDSHLPVLLSVCISSATRCAASPLWQWLAPVMMKRSSSPQPDAVSKHRRSPSHGFTLRRTSWQNRLPPVVELALKAVADALDGPVGLTVVVIATVIAIFLEDIKITSFSPAADSTFADISQSREQGEGSERGLSNGLESLFTL